MCFYGETDPRQTDDRIGVISFNLAGLHHALVAAILAYEGGIGVRNGCFCAQPYVMRLLDLGAADQDRWRRAQLAGDKTGRPGMVRVSLAAYNTSEDVDALVEMLNATGFFERIEKKIHPRGGDLVAYAFPNIALTAGEKEEHPHGQHGGLNTHRELHPVLFAYGRGVAPGPLGEIPQTRIARYVAELLAIAPPASAE
jgi:hypothetical protein